MKYVNDKFVELMNSQTENKETLVKIMAQVDDFMSDFKDDPSIISRWGHYYFCDIDGGRLIFDHKKRGVHCCEVCGKTFESEIFDGVWQYFYRNQAIVTALSSAFCYKATGEKRFLEYTKAIITYYADNYLEFKLHKKENDVYESYETMEWGCGRIMPQGLNESIIGIRVAQAYEIIADDVDAQFKQKLDDWFHEMYRLLKPQVVAIHNISVWADCVIAVMGFVCKDEEMVDFAFNSEFGLNNQLAKGVTEDKFWYEGSTHYNYFLLEGVCYAFLFAHLYDYKIDKECYDTIVAMYETGADFTFDNGFFPNPNDGWPNLNLKTYSYQYHTIARVLGEDSKIGQLVKFIENMEVPRTILPLSDAYYCENKTPLEKLLFNIDYDFSNYKKDKCSSHNYPKSNYSMLRNNKLNVFMKYGLNAKSHAHPDIMNIEVVYGETRVSRDLSNAGYRARLCNEWHRKTLAHNTVICDGKDMPSFERGECLAYAENHIKARAYTYEGVYYTREQITTENTVTDKFIAEGDKEHNFDYVFHIESNFTVKCEHELVKADLGYSENGYQHVIETNKVVAPPQTLELVAECDELKVNITLDTTGKEVYILKTMDNPVNKQRTTLLLREKSKVAVFDMKLQMEENKQ